MVAGKVINENKYPLIDEFKGRKIHIEPGQSISMDYYDYVEFRGNFPAGIKSKDDMFDGSGNQKPQSFKMIRYEGPMPHEDKKAAAFVCTACKGTFGNQKDLDAHVDEWHLDKLEDQDLAQERRNRQRK